jgi:hypothetical protein
VIDRILVILLNVLLWCWLSWGYKLEASERSMLQSPTVSPQAGTPVTGSPKIPGRVIENPVLNMNDKVTEFIKSKGITLDQIKETVVHGDRFSTSKKDVKICFSIECNISLLFNINTYEVISVDPEANMVWLDAYLMARDEANRRKRVPQK